MALGESSGEPPPVRSWASALEDVLHRHADSRSEVESRPAVMIGHSYGTLITAQLLRLRPHLFDGIVFLDPMCFMLHLPTTTNSFCYAEKPWTFAGFISSLVCSELLICIC